MTLNNGTVELFRQILKYTLFTNYSNHWNIRIAPDSSVQGKSNLLVYKYLPCLLP